MKLKRKASQIAWGTTGPYPYRVSPAYRTAIWVLAAVGLTYSVWQVTQTQLTFEMAKAWWIGHIVIEVFCFHLVMIGIFPGLYGKNAENSVEMPPIQLLKFGGIVFMATVVNAIFNSAFPALVWPAYAALLAVAWYACTKLFLFRYG